MNKLFTKIGTAIVGLAMAVGVGVAVGRDGVKEVKAIDSPLVFDFEDDGAHRASGSNSYTGTNNYSQNGAAITIVYGDCITTGSPIAGSANVLMRVKKNQTTNLPSVTIGSVSSLSSYRIVGITYKSKSVNSLTITSSYSTDNSNWTELEHHVGGSVSTYGSASGLSISSPANFYFKVAASITNGNSTNKDRDTQIDDINIIFAQQGNIKPKTITAKQSNETVIEKDETISYSDPIGASTTLQFKVSATYESGEGYSTGSSFVWSSSNTNVATIEESGSTVTAVLKSKGTTTITVSTGDASDNNDNISTSFVLDTTGASYDKGHSKNPYLPSEAITYISGFSNSDETTSSYYVAGYVTSKQTGSYSSYDYWIGDTADTEKDDSLYIFRGVLQADYSKLNVGDKVLVCGKFQKYSGTPEVKSSTFVNKYIALDSWKKNNDGLDMDGYDSSKTGSGDGSCTTRYWIAKNALKQVNDSYPGALSLLQESSDFADARARYEGWAGVNGDSATKYDMSVLEPAGSVRIETFSNSNNNAGVIAIIVIGAAISTIAIVGFVLTKKRKED